MISEVMCIGLWVLLSYIVGAIPVGFLIARVVGIKDITEHGSGTMGATNVAPALGMRYFFLVFFIDAGKAALFLYYAPVSVWHLSIIGLMIGNTRSLFLCGGGGKGLATLLGILFVIKPFFVIPFLVIWVAGIYVLRSVGKSSTCGLLLLLAMFIVWPIMHIWWALCGAIMWSLYCHRMYLNKLLHGE